jgi:hypothetical protein
VQRLQVYLGLRTFARRAGTEQASRTLDQLRLPGCDLRRMHVVNASSASVFSPLSAAKATFALNAGLRVEDAGASVLDSSQCNIGRDGGSWGETRRMKKGITQINANVRG